jgi:hypothetical protein
MFRQPLGQGADHFFSTLPVLAGVTVFWRYWLLQIPGWVLLVALLFGAREWLGISTTLALLVFMAWLVKDAAIYPWLRPHYEVRSADLKDALWERAREQSSR